MADQDAKEKKRRKHQKRLSKILANAWGLSGSKPFQDVKPSSATSIIGLSQIGEKIDNAQYRLGRHGWEDFARDIGGVYNRHIHRKLKNAKLAVDHLKQVSEWLGKIDESLSKLCNEHIPADDSAKSVGKKRKAASDNAAARNKRRSTSSESAAKQGDLTLGQREENALQALSNFITENGGTPEMVQSFRCRVTRKPSDGRYDTNFYNEQNRRFRSMLEVGRFFTLIKDKDSTIRRRTIKTKKITSREIEAEKKRLRKDLDRLRKQHTRATKNLNDYMEGEKDATHPVEDTLLIADVQPHQRQQKQADTTSSSTTEAAATVSTTSKTLKRCAGHRQPDFVGLENIPKGCVPDVLMAWDFLCTFSRLLHLQPISLVDFVQALTYRPAAQLADADALNTPPVYLAEAHIGLLRILIDDPSSDDWWWSILETVEEAEMGMGAKAEKDETETDLPVIKVDFDALLAENEDPLLTTSWMQNLSQVRQESKDLKSVQQSIKLAISVMDNKYVKAYLRKALKLAKSSDAGAMRRAVLWLVDHVREARPDLFNRGVTKSAALKQRAKTVEEVTAKMEKLSKATIAVTEDDLGSDLESDDDDDSDDESDEEENATKTTEKTALHLQSEDRPASAIPEPPLPTLVDLLLPPAKPLFELLNPFSWPHMAGATAHRILHRYKRLRNEVDDSLRQYHDLPQVTISQRNQREKMAAARTLSECFCAADGEETSVHHAIDFLCKGGNYLELSTEARLCILRILIDAAYDTVQVFRVVDSNHNQRISATKALDTEQRRTKKQVKEKAASDEAAARQDLADEIRSKFIEEKREEIRQANASSQELTEEDIDALTDEDIIGFDEDIKTDYDALPGPESFKKTEVTGRVERIQEAAAFDADSVEILTMTDILDREEQDLQALKQDLEHLGGEEALDDPATERATARSIDKLRREINRVKKSKNGLQYERDVAIETLKDSIADGTVKSLRNAIRLAKAAKLFAVDPGTRTAWALDTVKDAHVELERAKQQKRVADAQKDLITKLNRCFTRTLPVGMDRVRNRFWHFEHGDQGHVWVEADYDVSNNRDNGSSSNGNGTSTKSEGFLSLTADPASISIGPQDMEEDFFPSLENPAVEIADTQKMVNRQEYHPSSQLSTLASRHWGCHTTEESLRSVIKELDARGLREGSLKQRLKETVETTTAHHDPHHEEENHHQQQQEHEQEQQQQSEEAGEPEAADSAKSKTSEMPSGDEEEFQKLKRGIDEEEQRSHPSNIVSTKHVANMTTAIGQKVRTRTIAQTTKDGEVAQYENGTVVGWKYRPEMIPIQPDGDEFEPTMRSVMVPLWKMKCDRGKIAWLKGTELLESICRYAKMQRTDADYFENDASYLAYRNSMGRFCGRAADAMQAMTPYRFAQMMVKKEAEMYSKLKQRLLDSTWGGRGANRNAWISSMKDFTFEFHSVREGLLTLENAFFELTGGLIGGPAETLSAQEMLANADTRRDIELESLEKTVSGIWNSHASRAIFIDIMKNATSLGFLWLGLELLVRNTRAYLDATKPAKATQQESYYEQAPMRVTRRMNAWQQANQNSWS